MSWRKFSAILLVSGLALKAHAGMLFEPMVAYESGSTNIDYTSLGTNLKGTSGEKTSNSAINFGGRLGYVTSSGLWLAGNVMTSTSGKAKFDTYEYEMVRTTMGVDLGVAQGRWNFWLGYSPSDRVVLKNSDIGSKNTVLGTSMKMGVGCLLVRHLQIYLEYALRTYNKADSNSTDIEYMDYSNYISSFKQQSFNAGVSFPF